MTKGLWRWYTLIKALVNILTLGKIKKTSMFRVTDLKILGRVGTDFFLIIFFLENIQFYTFWKAFRLTKCIQLFFQKTWKNIWVSSVNLGSVGLP